MKDSQIQTERQGASSVQRMVRLLNAITDAVREMEKCPDDSTQDIWNEALESWETGLRMNHLLEVEPNDGAVRQSPAPETP